MKFYVISPSDTKQDYVTLLKAEPLTVEEVNTYGAGHVNMYSTSNTSASCYQTAYDFNGYGGMAYYSSSTCGYNGTSLVDDGCTNDYKESEIKYVVDAWSKAKLIQSELKEVDGYSARLITYEELINYLMEDKVYSTPSGDVYYKNSKYDWVYNSNYWYWTMSPYNDSASNVWYVSSRGSLNYCSRTTYTMGDGYYVVVRPVINLLKSAIK